MCKIFWVGPLLLLFIQCREVIPVDSAPDKEKVLNYLALGDSYTIGQSVAEEERYPAIFVEKFREDNGDMNAPRIIARTGWRTDQLSEAIASEITTERFDLVSLLIGVNNQFQGRAIEAYKTEFEQLLQKAISLANGNSQRVFVLSIPDYAYTPFGQGNDTNTISKEIDEFNAVNMEICEEFEITYYNITPISRLGLLNPTLVASDGLHPSAVMYELWVNQFYEEVVSKLN